MPSPSMPVASESVKLLPYRASKKKRKSSGAISSVLYAVVYELRVAVCTLYPPPARTLRPPVLMLISMALPGG